MFFKKDSLNDTLLMNFVQQILHICPPWTLINKLYKLWSWSNHWCRQNSQPKIHLASYFSIAYLQFKIQIPSNKNVQTVKNASTMHTS